MGGHLKNAVALGFGSGPMQVVLSSHVGDLDSLASKPRCSSGPSPTSSIFFAVTPAVVACDLHPDYASTRHAEQLAARWGRAGAPVQHHHAHVAACMAEHRLPGPLLGLAWDGTGYGGDGTIWGGKALACAKGPPIAASPLRGFALPGGDAAIRPPRRSALGLLYEILGDAAAREVTGDADGFSPSELERCRRARAFGPLPATTSSMGRLFRRRGSVVRAAAGDQLRGASGDGPGIRRRQGRDRRLSFPAGQKRSPAVADWEPLVRAVLADRAAGVPIGRIAAQFHNALAELAVAIARRTGLQSRSAAGVSKMPS